MCRVRKRKRKVTEKGKYWIDLKFFFKPGNWGKYWFCQISQYFFVVIKNTSIEEYNYMILIQNMETILNVKSIYRQIFIRYLLLLTL